MRATLLPYAAIRCLTMVWPVTAFSGSASLGSIFKSSAHNQPYELPDIRQVFTSATLSLLFYFQGDANVSYAYDPNNILEMRLNLWSLDQSGNDIEQVIANGDLPAWGCLPVSGTLHGYKQTGKLICGFRAAGTIYYGAGTVILPPRMLALFTNFQ